MCRSEKLSPNAFLPVFSVIVFAAASNSATVQPFFGSATPAAANASLL